MSPERLARCHARTAWFEPLVEGTTAFALGLPAARRFCNGVFFPDGSTVPPNGVEMARVDAPNTSSPLGWNAESTDINLDGAFSGFGTSTPLLLGFNDWTQVRLDQTGAGRPLAGLSQDDHTAGDAEGSGEH